MVVVNSCSVTAAADQGVRQTVRRIVRDNPDVQVVVTGCYATRRPDEIRQLPNIVHVVSNDEKDDLVANLACSIGLTDRADATTANRYGNGDGPCGETLSPGAAGRTALTLRVQTGCDERCSYCIIPRTRGRGRSRPLADVIRQIDDAIASGYREIAIAGVHLGSYGRDLGGSASLATLVRVLGEWNADVIFRISSLEPMDCTPEIVDLVASSPRLAPHFHLPLQHGSDECFGRCGGLTRHRSMPGSSRRFVRVFPMPPSAPISSSGFQGNHLCISRRPKPLSRPSADTPACLSILGQARDRCRVAR